MARTPLRPVALTARPFRGSAAVAGGLLTEDQLRSACWRRLFRDVYVDTRRPDDHRLRVQGAALILPDGAAVSGRSAAHLYGAGSYGGGLVATCDPGLITAGEPVEIAASAPFGPVAGLRIRQRLLRRDDTRLFAGVPVTTPLATAYELARSLPLEEAVVWLDALGHARHLAREDLRAYVASHAGETGSRLAARAVDLCDPRAESPPESRVRLWLTLAGLPPPVPQYDILDNGLFVARVDLAWPHLRLALEYDGEWHASLGQLGRDRRRVRDLNALGWYVYPVTAADLHHPDQLVGAVTNLLAHSLIR